MRFSQDKREQLKMIEIKKRLDLARKYFQMAKKLQARKDFSRGAMDLGYNAAELCAKGLILLKEEDIPSRHGSITQKFSELYVKTGILPSDFGKKMRLGLKFRNLARYEHAAQVGEMIVGHVLGLAEDLIKILEKEIKKP